MRVLVACEFSGVVRDAFAAQGHDAWSCDLLPSMRNGKHLRGNVLNFLDKGWDLMVAHPPCTYLSTVGNSHFLNNPDRYRKQLEALVFFGDLLLAPIPRIAIENPVGVASTKIRKPDQIVQPFFFGDEDRKATCLWLKNLPLLKTTEVVEPLLTTRSTGKVVSMYQDEAVRLPKRVRGYVRSITYPGFAAAMAQQWGSLN